MRLIASFLFLAVFPAVVSAAEISPALQRVLDTLQSRPLICADFEQKKFLQVLAHPLVSRGRMVFRRGEGVVWQVLDPCPAVVTLRQSSMTRWDESGKAQVLDYGRNPVFGTLAGTLMAIVSGDLEVLQESFEVLPQAPENAEWHLSLMPKRQELAGLVKSVGVAGNTFAREIRIEENGGDKTVIGFGNVDFDTCHLTAAEKAYFEK